MSQINRIEWLTHYFLTREWLAEERMKMQYTMSNAISTSYSTCERCVCITISTPPATVLYDFYFLFLLFILFIIYVLFLFRCFAIPSIIFYAPQVLPYICARIICCLLFCFPVAHSNALLSHFRTVFCFTLFFKINFTLMICYNLQCY